jgi:uncharacterized protein
MIAHENGSTYSHLIEQITPRGPWQQTATGQAFFPGDPRPEEVHFEDLAFSLSRQCRFNGHLAANVEHYSVAQHETLVSLWMEEDGCSLGACYAGLHHDSAEGYTGDFVSQVKFCVPDLRPFLRKVEDAVDCALGVTWTPTLRTIVKQYDLVALATEIRWLLAPNHTSYSWGAALPPPRPGPLIALGATEARRQFKIRHWELRCRLLMPAYLPSDNSEQGIQP